MAKELQQSLFSSREREVKRAPVMDNRMVCAIQPFLDRLIQRYSQVAKTGNSNIPDPLCAATKGRSCVHCPVFGPRGNANFIHCEKYYPAKPECVNDTTRAISTATSIKYREENIETAKAWGAKVVQWLEDLQEEA